jgi:hypothetical protein
VSESAARVTLQVELQGFALIPDLLIPSQIEAIERSLAGVIDGAGVRSRGAVYAVRDLLSKTADLRAFAVADPLIGLVRSVIGDGARPVRGLLFDKNPDANWLVPWHQDLTICVREKRDVPGFGPWSMKAGLVHVQPSLDVLHNMVAVRLHLDPAGEENGRFECCPEPTRPDV